jgi:tripartite-type tricarboxylate transporter receptor subunit TctC
VRIIVGFPPGGLNDITARLIGQALPERLGQNSLVDNRPGAAGNIGTEAVVRAAPDGLTLLLASTPDFINATLYEKLNRGSGPMVTDLLGGQVQVTFDTLPSSIEHIRAGKLRALAVTTATHLEALPGVPTVAEVLPGFEASAVSAIGAPKKTPTEIIERLNKEINSSLADPKMQARLADLGGTPLVLSPDGFGKLIVDETEKWAKVIKFAGIIERQKRGTARNRARRQF